MHTKDLIELIATAPSADNSQPWKFIQFDNSIVCRYKDRAAKFDPFGPFGHGSLIAAGALLENLNALQPERSQPPQITLDESGWHFLFDPASWPTTPNPEAKCSLLARHTNRHPFIALPSQPTRLPSHQLSARCVLLTTTEHIKLLARALLACSMARFNNHELHEWLFSSLRWSPADVESGTGLDIETLHLPPGGRQFMQFIAPWERMRLLNRFGIYRLLAVADLALFRQAPGVIAFIGGPSPHEIIECGQLMQRTWLSLNSQGIAVHPYYALTDLSNRMRNNKLDGHWARKVAQAQAMASDALKLQQQEHIHMLFRIGTPTCNPVRSRRLPLSSLIE